LVGTLEHTQNKLPERVERRKHTVRRIPGVVSFRALLPPAVAHDDEPPHATDFVFVSIHDNTPAKINPFFKRSVHSLSEIELQLSPVAIGTRDHLPGAQRLPLKM
jgi:hypothetical protein